MIELTTRLKDRGNRAYKFFEQVLTELREEHTYAAAMEKLLTCFAITQYADFTPDEERLLSEVINANANL